MTDEKKYLVQFEGLLGTSKPFKQGGTWRITIPKAVVNRYKIEEESKSKLLSYAFIATNKGIMLIPLHALITPKVLENALEQ